MHSLRMTRDNIFEDSEELDVADTADKTSESYLVTISAGELPFFLDSSLKLICCFQKNCFVFVIILAVTDVAS